MPTRSLGLKILFSDHKKKAGCIINEMPQFKGNVLIDDTLQCVFKKYLDNGKPVIAMFPYDLHRTFTK